MSEIKLTEEELKRIQSLNTEFTKSKIEIADNFLVMLKLAGNLDDLRKAFAVDEKDLAKKYGENAQIDIATGVVTKKEKEEK